MANEILGVSFDAGRDGTGACTIQVVSVKPNSSAIEFIVEVHRKAWASQVIAVRSGSTVVVPASVNARSAQIRLFDGVGKELTKGSRFEISFNPDSTISQSERFSAKNIFFVLSIALVCGYFILSSSGFLMTMGEFGLTTPATPTLAVLSRNANLRSQPQLFKGNVLTILPFGTQVFGIAQSGEFLEVQVFGGQKGFVHKDVVGDAAKVHLLGGRDSLDQAKSCKDERRAAIISLAGKLKPHVLSVSLFSDIDTEKLNLMLQDAVQKSPGDDVTGRFFHYLAEESAARKHLADVITYFRAASIVQPISINDVHGWGISQLKQAGEIDESAMLHAVIVAPRAANTWVVVAGHLSRSNDDFAVERTVKALRLALEFSKDRVVTRRFLEELRQAPVNSVFRKAVTLALS